MRRVTTIGVIWLVMWSSARADPRPLEHSHLGEPVPSPSSHVVYHALDFGAATLDIYTADPVAGRPPVVVYLHAGGDVTRLARDLTTRLGSVLVAIARADVEDIVIAQRVAEALVWVEDNIADFGGDPGRLVLMGHGSEARLASLVACDERYLRAVGRDASLLAGVVAIDGDGFYDEGGEDEGAVAPANHVASGKSIAPHLLLHVTAAVDPASESELQSNLLAAALRSAGVRADVTALDHVDHLGALSHLGIPGDATTAALERFLGRLAGPSEAPATR